jgi:hypothetical protein
MPFHGNRRQLWTARRRAAIAGLMYVGASIDDFLAEECRNYFRNC